MSFPRSSLIALVPVLFAACVADSAPAGLRATPNGTGPRVVFDLNRRPLPEIPAPNDIATFPDPTSRTGRRLNASIMAPTNMERHSRAEFDEMEGWGTFAPIFVRFDRGPTGDAAQPAIDLENVKRRMQDDGYEFGNDAVYVINLKTGVPVLLDVGHGNFPPAVSDPAHYWPNDPRGAESSLVFETVEEGAGLTQADYRPELDTDFDGVLDHPNTLGRAASPKTEGVDNLLTWYERETDTLIVRPILPLDEMTEYAVVLTDRLVGTDGQPVRSPFPFIHHAQQRDGVAKVRGILADGSRANYYGDLAGTGLDHVAFAWTFTTQPVYEDMRVLRDGLYGKGPFARFSADFPPKVELFRAVGLALDESEEPPGWQAKPECAPVAGRPFIANSDHAKVTVRDFLLNILKVHPNQADQLSEELSNVAHFVIGTYDAPFLMGDPRSTDPYDHWRINFMTGATAVYRDKIHFFLAVPKTRPEKGFQQPFPVSFWRHGTAQSDFEVLIHAGHFAANGVALFGIDAPGHGLYLDPGQKLLARAFLSQSCIAPWLNGLSAGRAIDLDADGVPDSGGLLWSAHVAHSRDEIRQGTLESLQGMRVLRSFDGKNLGDDYTGDGKPEVAGDFDGDGTPDVGGPDVRYYTAGDSFGGIMAQIQGALDPFISAAVPISGGGGLIEIAARSSLVPDSVIEQILSPFVIAIPAEDRPADSSGPNTACKPGQRSVRFVVNDLLKSKEMEIACLEPGELGEKMTIILTNLATKEKKCVRSGKDGRFRVPIPANRGDRLDVQVFPQADVIDSYATCNVIGVPAAGRRVHTWEVGARKFGPVADSSLTCTADGGCQQYHDTFYDVGSDLVAPKEGLGEQRQTPQFRKLLNLVQAAVDPSDPINYAPYYMLRTVPSIDGTPTLPRALLDLHTIGDPYVPIGSGNAFSRAAGVIPFLPSSFAAKYPEYANYAMPAAFDAIWGGKSPNELLIQNALLEGQPRFARTPAGASCGRNYRKSADCTDTPTPDPSTCSQSLFDADWLSEGKELFDQQHPKALLRLARQANVRATDAGSLAASWSPRATMAQAADDAAGWKPGAPLAAVVNTYMTPLGQHVWFIGDPCKAWDDVTYNENLIARFLGSGGTDLYYLTHPASHGCMADRSCAYLK